MVLVLAILTAWLGLNAPMGATAIQVSSPVAYAQVFDARPLSTAAFDTTTERGLPAESGNSTTCDTDGHWSLGAPARPSAAIHASDNPAQLAQSANAVMAIPEATRGSTGAFVSMTRSIVAAKAEVLRSCSAEVAPRGSPELSTMRSRTVPQPS